MSIKLYTGPMFSGKTTSMLADVERYKRSGKNCIILRPSIDTRGSTITSHCGMTPGDIKTVSVSDLCGFDFASFDVIGIDEGQFFGSLSWCCSALAGVGKIVIVSGLDTDYAQRPFAEIAALIPVCDKIKKRRAICPCGKKAIYTFRKSTSVELICIGGAEEYQPICRFCVNSIDQ